MPGTAEVGGIETFTFTVGEAMQRLGHEVVLYGGRPKPGRSHRETCLRLKLHDYLETKDILDIGTRFQRLVQRLHFGWVSKHDWMNEHLDAVILAKTFDWPLAWYWKKKQPSLRTVMGFHGTEFFAGDRLFWGAIDRCFAVSQPVANEAFKRISVRPEVISNPVDTEFYDPDIMTGYEGGTTLHIRASGRLVGWKGFGKLIEALALLKKRGRSFECRIAGDGPAAELLQQTIRLQGLENNVIMEGLLCRTALRDFLASGDVYVAPSIGLDAFSIAALEAASMGLTLILSDKIGLSGFLNSDDFVSYPHQAAEQLAECLNAVSLKPSTDVRKARHQRIRESFSPESCAIKILQKCTD